jgi:hypothetical protein
MGKAPSWDLEKRGSPGEESAREVAKGWLAKFNVANQVSTNGALIFSLTFTPKTGYNKGGEVLQSR